MTKIEKALETLKAMEKMVEEKLGTSEAENFLDKIMGLGLTLDEVEMNIHRDKAEAEMVEGPICPTDTIAEHIQALTEEAFDPRDGDHLAEVYRQLRILHDAQRVMIQRGREFYG